MVLVPSLADLAVWFAVSAVLTLVASELLSPCYRLNLLIEIKKLRMVAIGFGMTFIFIAAIEIASRISAQNDFLLLSLVLSMVIMVLGISSVQSYSDPSMDQALKSINEASAEGADVSVLVERFNYALNFLREAEISDTKNCSYDECVPRANEIFMSIIDDATILKEKAKEVSVHERMLTFILFAPLSAFTASILGIYSYIAWKSYQMKKFLNMEIREKEN